MRGISLASAMQAFVSFGGVIESLPLWAIHGGDYKDQPPPRGCAQCPSILLGIGVRFICGPGNGLLLF